MFNRIKRFFSRLKINKQLIEEIRTALATYDIVRVRYRYNDDACEGYRLCKKKFWNKRKYIVQGSINMLIFGERTVTISKVNPIDTSRIYHIDM